MTVLVLNIPRTEPLPAEDAALALQQIVSDFHTTTACHLLLAGLALLSHDYAICNVNIG